jgi:hypothetical protein
MSTYKKIYFLYLKTDDPGRLEALLSRNGHSSFEISQQP